MNLKKKFVTTRLSEWVCGLDTTEIPESIRLSAQRFLIDTVGVAIAGSETRVAKLARNFSKETADKEFNAKVLGVNQRLSAKTAAFVNGVAAHALDFDDNSYAGFVHGSAVIVPAALAVSQELNTSSRRLITALIVGAECEYAIGAASKNVLYDKGWWTTGVLGPIGACAATSYILQLDTDQTASALGLAIVGSGGMKACFGTDAKALMAGRAAESGVVSALLAAHGARGPYDVIENATGFINLFNNGEFDFSVLDTLGSTWFLEQPGIDVKRIPVCLSSHASVDAVLNLVDKHKISLHNIEGIVCDVPPIVYKNLAYAHPKTVQQAQFSLQYAIATSLHFGKFGLEHLDTGLIQSDLLLPLMSRISMQSSGMWNDIEIRASAPEGAQVTISQLSGELYKTFQASAHGSAIHPLNNDEIDDKFLGCVSPVLGHISAHHLLDSLKNIDSDVPMQSVL
jgi:2-methylcitrate dehydratase PrpD